MKIWYRRFTPRSGLSAAMALALMAQGCAPTLIQIDKQELARLKDQEDIQAVRYDLPPRPDWDECNEKANVYDKLSPIWGLLGGALGGLLSATTALADVKDCLERAADRYLDVSTQVKDRFVAEVSRQLGLQNVRSVPESLSSDDLDFLRQRFGTAMVLDFKVTSWELVTTASYWTAPRGSYQVPTAMRARLLRLSDSSILWQQACKFRGTALDTSAEAQPLGEFVQLLSENVEREAKGCADELVGQFLSQETPAK